MNFENSELEIKSVKFNNEKNSKSKPAQKVASYCINPYCRQRRNLEEAEDCTSCKTPLLINNRFRLIKPLRPLSPRRTKDIFEVVDLQGVGYGDKWVVRPGTHRVMKVLKLKNLKLMQMMEQEAKILRKLNVAGIPKVYSDDYFTFTSFNESLELQCLVLEKIEGQALDKWIKNCGAISQDRALDWLKQLAQILHHVHQAKLFHRDIKPSNIIVNNEDRLFLIDFEGSREITDTYLVKISGAENTTGISTLGDVTAIISSGYTPPEQFNAKALPQSDFYALGRTFVHLMTGIHPSKLPFDEKTGELKWRKKVEQIEKPFADLIDELQALAPGKRPLNTTVFLQRLEDLPNQIKRRHLIKSKEFGIGVGVVSLLLGFGIYKMSLPWIAEIKFSQGVSALQQNRLNDAEKEFQFATFLNPDLSNSISKSYLIQGNQKNNSPELARKFYDQAVKYNPNNIDAYNNLALVCQDLNDENCVITNYAKLFNLQPSHWEGRIGLANFYENQGKYKAAREQYNEAIKVSKKSAIQALNNLARINNLEGNYSDAVKLATDGLQRTKDPKAQAGLLKNLGWALLEQKKLEASRDILREAQIKDDERTDVYCLLARSEAALKDTKNAATNWNNCLRMPSNSPEVEQWREQMLDRLVEVLSHR